MIRKNVSEPWFSLIATGQKTVEGRLDKGGFAPGDVIMWTNDQLGFERSFRTRVVAVATYGSFRAMLKAETLRATLPAFGVTSVEKGVAVYRRFYDAESEKKHGVAAIRLEVLPRA